MAATFFRDPHMQQLLTSAGAVLAGARAQHTATDFEKKKYGAIEQVLSTMQRAAAEFDELCESNIDWIGHSLRSELTDIGNGITSPEKTDALTGTLYRFLIELQLTAPGELSRELSSFVLFVEENTPAFNGGAQLQIAFAERSMPIRILKRILGSELLQNIRSVNTYSAKVDSSFQEWEKRLNERQARAEALADSIKKHENAFNFVGLYKGFDDLSKAKRTELWGQRAAMLGLAFLAVLPLLVEIGFIAWAHERIEQYRWTLIASAIPALSLTALLVYFFRLSVRAADSAKSQLLQIELRKTLCQFVQDYAEYAKQIRAGSPDILSKFEGVVFSGIVGSDEKIPATFDGLDQISRLVRSLKSSA